MIEFQLGQQGVRHPNRAGAILGQQHLAPLMEQLGAGPDPNGPGELVVMDWDGVATATGSYVKATTIHLLGRAGAFDLSALPGEASRAPLNIFPVMTGLSAEVREEIDDQLLLRKLTALEVTGVEGERVLRAALRGVLDGIVVDTLRALTDEGEATASQLLERYGGGINVTGWNNRLFDLYRLRLARRRKEGRFWVYAPIAEEIVEAAMELEVANG